jgi:integrase
VSVANGKDLRSKKVEVALTEFVKHLSEAEKHRSTLHDKLLFLNRVKEFLRGKRLNEVNTKTLMELNDWLRERARNKTLSQTSLKRYTANLKQFFTWCVDNDYLENAPKQPKVRIEGNRRPHFDNKDWARLTRHMREFVKDQPAWVVRDRTMLVNYVLILANTGIRVGEARTLKWRDLREIPAPKDSNQPPDIALYVNGKTGPREVVARTSDVKTYFKRILELRTNELKDQIAKEKDPIKARNMKVRPSADDYIFCNRDGTPIGSFKKSFAALLKSAGVETDSHGQKRTIYSLRHTYATFRLQEGVHQFILAKNMGTSTAMLEKHYGHTSNVASAAELTKGGRFKGGGKATAVDWLME